MSAEYRVLSTENWQSRRVLLLLVSSPSPKGARKGEEEEGEGEGKGKKQILFDVSSSASWYFSCKLSFAKEDSKSEKE